MAFRINKSNELKGILFLLLLAIPIIASNVDCKGKAFHCVNETHFMICVDLGGGLSSTIDEFIIPCPPTTFCKSNNHFECEFGRVTTLAPSFPVEAVVTATNEIINTTPEVTTAILFSEYYNTLSTATLSDAWQSPAATSSVKTESPVVEASVTNSEVLTDYSVSDLAVTRNSSNDSTSIKNLNGTGSIVITNAKESSTIDPGFTNNTIYENITVTSAETSSVVTEPPVVHASVTNREALTDNSVPDLAVTRNSSNDSTSIKNFNGTSSVVSTNTEESATINSSFANNTIYENITEKLAAISSIATEPPVVDASETNSEAITDYSVPDLGVTRNSSNDSTDIRNLNVTSLIVNTNAEESATIDPGFANNTIYENITVTPASTSSVATEPLVVDASITNREALTDYSVPDLAVTRNSSNDSTSIKIFNGTSSVVSTNAEESATIDPAFANNTIYDNITETPAAIYSVATEPPVVDVSVTNSEVITDYSAPDLSVTRNISNNSTSIRNLNGTSSIVGTSAEESATFDPGFANYSSYETITGIPAAISSIATEPPVADAKVTNREVLTDYSLPDLALTVNNPNDSTSIRNFNGTSSVFSTNAKESTTIDPGFANNTIYENITETLAAISSVATEPPVLDASETNSEAITDYSGPDLSVTRNSSNNSTSIRNLNGTSSIVGTNAEETATINPGFANNTIYENITVTPAATSSEATVSHVVNATVTNSEMITHYSVPVTDQGATRNSSHYSTSDRILNVTSLIITDAGESVTIDPELANNTIYENITVASAEISSVTTESPVINASVTNSEVVTDYSVPHLGVTRNSSNHSTSIRNLNVTSLIVSTNAEESATIDPGFADKTINKNITETPAAISSVATEPPVVDASTTNSEVITDYSVLDRGITRNSSEDSASIRNLNVTSLIVSTNAKESAKINSSFANNVTYNNITETPAAISSVATKSPVVDARVTNSEVVTGYSVRVTDQGVTINSSNDSTSHRNINLTINNAEKSATIDSGFANNIIYEYTTIPPAAISSVTSESPAEEANVNTSVLSAAISSATTGFPVVDASLTNSGVVTEYNVSGTEKIVTRNSSNYSTLYSNLKITSSLDISNTEKNITLDLGIENSTTNENTTLSWKSFTNTQEFTIPDQPVAITANEIVEDVTTAVPAVKNTSLSKDFELTTNKIMVDSSKDKSKAETNDPDLPNEIVLFPDHVVGEATQTEILAVDIKKQNFGATASDFSVTLNSNTSGMVTKSAFVVDKMTTIANNKELPTDATRETLASEKNKSSNVTTDTNEIPATSVQSTSVEFDNIATEIYMPVGKKDTFTKSITAIIDEALYEGNTAINVNNTNSGDKTQSLERSKTFSDATTTTVIDVYGYVTNVRNASNYDRKSTHAEDIMKNLDTTSNFIPKTLKESIVQADNQYESTTQLVPETSFTVSGLSIIDKVNQTNNINTTIIRNTTKTIFSSSTEISNISEKSTINDTGISTLLAPEVIISDQSQVLNSEIPIGNNYAIQGQSYETTILTTVTPNSVSDNLSNNYDYEDTNKQLSVSITTSSRLTVPPEISSTFSTLEKTVLFNTSTLPAKLNNSVVTHGTIIMQDPLLVTSSPREENEITERYASVLNEISQDDVSAIITTESSYITTDITGTNNRILLTPTTLHTTKYFNGFKEESTYDHTEKIFNMNSPSDSKSAQLEQQGTDSSTKSEATIITSYLDNNETYAKTDSLLEGNTKPVGVFEEKINLQMNDVINSNNTANLDTLKKSQFKQNQKTPVISHNTRKPPSIINEQLVNEASQQQEQESTEHMTTLKFDNTRNANSPQYQSITSLIGSIENHKHPMDVDANANSSSDLTLAEKARSTYNHSMNIQKNSKNVYLEHEENISKPSNIKDYGGKSVQATEMTIEPYNRQSAIGKSTDADLLRVKEQQFNNTIFQTPNATFAIGSTSSLDVQQDETSISGTNISRSTDTPMIKMETMNYIGQSTLYQNSFEPVKPFKTTNDQSLVYEDIKKDPGLSTLTTKNSEIQQLLVERSTQSAKVSIMQTLGYNDKDVSTTTSSPITTFKQEISVKENISENHTTKKETNTLITDYSVVTESVKGVTMAATISPASVTWPQTLPTLNRKYDTLSSNVINTDTNIAKTNTVTSTIEKALPLSLKNTFSSPKTLLTENPEIIITTSRTSSSNLAESQTINAKKYSFLTISAENDRGHTISNYGGTEAFEITTSIYDTDITSSKLADQNNDTTYTSSTTVDISNQKRIPQLTQQTKFIPSKQEFVTRTPLFVSTSTHKTYSNKFHCQRTKRGRYADNNDCQRFYICIGRIEPIQGTCPDNTVFSETKKQCTKNLSHCIRNNQFQCVNVGRFSDFLKDNVYYICAKKDSRTFTRYKLQCQDGYHLNKTTVKCVLNTDSNQSSGAESSKNNSDQNDSISMSKTSKKDKDKSRESFICKKEGKFPDPSDCRRYFICKEKEKSEYRQKRKKCDSDEIYHKDKKKCVDADSYECTY